MLVISPVKALCIVVGQTDSTNSDVCGTAGRTPAKSAESIVAFKNRFDFASADCPLLLLIDTCPLAFCQTALFSAVARKATHESIADLSVIRSLPGIVVITASDHEQVRTILPVIAEYKGPVYLRLSRAEVTDFHNKDQQFKLGKGILLKEGKDLALIGTGTIMSRVLKAASLLNSQGIETAVVEIPTLKPLDVQLIESMARGTGALVTCEENTIIGGLGSAVAESLSETFPVPIIRVGINDCFGETGPYEKLLDKYGMSVEDIVNAGVKAVNLKGRK